MFAFISRIADFRQTISCQHGGDQGSFVLLYAADFSIVEQAVFAVSAGQFDQPVAVGDEQGVVFSNYQCRSLIAKFFQGQNETGYILVVQAHAGFIEQVQGFFCFAIPNKGSQSYPLRFAAGQSRRRLPQGEIPQTQIG